MTKVDTIPKPNTDMGSMKPTEEETELMRTLDQREMTYMKSMNKVGQTWKYKFHDIKTKKDVTVHTRIEPRDLPVTFKYMKDYCIPFLPIKGKERYRNIADRFVDLIYELPDNRLTTEPEQYSIDHSSVSDDQPSVRDIDNQKMASVTGLSQEGSQSLTEPLNKYILELNRENIKKYFKLEKFSDEEIEMSLQLCILQNLNPFINDVYLIPYKDKIQMVVSKDVFLKKAEQHEDYEGFEAGLVLTDESGEIVFLPGSFIPPAHYIQGGYAKVFRKNMKEFRAVVGLKEYKSTNPKSLWFKLENTMIRKVALVQAMREAFPAALQGMYDRAEIEEMN